MAVIKKVNSKRSLKDAIKYITNKKKTEDGHFVDGYNCSPLTAADEMDAVKFAWGKTGGRTYMHFSQSFKPGEISPWLAHQVARDFCEAPFFAGFQIVFSTHTDKNHVHNHFVVNSVNMDDGRKLHMDMTDLQALRDYSDQLCRDFGLSVIKPEENIEGISTNTYKKFKAIERAKAGGYKGYIYNCHVAVKEAAAEAVSRDDFIERLYKAGYSTVWTETKKHITFTDADGKKFRAANLEKSFKEPFNENALLLQFEQNAERRRKRPTVKEFEEFQAEAEALISDILERNEAAEKKTHSRGEHER